MHHLFILRFLESRNASDKNPKSKTNPCLSVGEKKRALWIASRDTAMTVRGWGGAKKKFSFIFLPLVKVGVNMIYYAPIVHRKEEKHG